MLLPLTSLSSITLRGCKMSRMSDLYLEVQELVVDAVSTPGIFYDTDVLDYVNDRCSVEVDLETVEAILDSFFGEDYYPEGVVIQ